MDNPDSPIRNVRIWAAHERLGWWILGLVLLAVLGLVVERYLPWLIFGLFIYYVAQPIMQRLERRIASPTLVAVLTLLLIVIPIVVMLSAILLVAIGQLGTTVADLPVDRILAQLPVPVSDLPNTPSEVYDTTVVLVQDPSVQTLVGTVGQAIGTIGAVVFNMFLSLLIAFFLLVSDRDLSDWFESNVFGEDSLATKYLSTVDRGLGSIYFGYTMTIFAVIILSAIIYTMFNFFAPGGLSIPSVVLFAVVTGFFTLVPLVGRSIVYFTIAATLAVQAVTVDPRLLWFPLVFLAVMIVAFDNLVRTYIRPYLSGRLLNTGLVMFAYLFGPPLFGWYGIFLGPFLMVFVVTFVQMILPVLANPERERTDVGSEHTLDEFSKSIVDREGERPSETYGSDLGPDGDPTA
jgi:predicted PurR-regulated permease PerM